MIINHRGVLMRLGLCAEGVRVQQVAIVGGGVQVLNERMMRYVTAERVGLLVGGVICTRGLDACLNELCLKGVAV